MKKLLKLLCLLCFFNILWLKAKSQRDPDDDSRRVSFIVGPGASIITQNLYDDPSVNQTNNIVNIEKAARLKSNLAIGIIYTPKVRTVFDTIPIVREDGLNVDQKLLIERVPRGRTYAVFVNPIALSKATDTQPFFNMIDFGFGIGHRTSGGLLVMGTAEFFYVRQPRKWFISQFKDRNLTYEIEGAPQKSIDINDNNIFKYQPVLTLGVKFCYTFDIVKRYVETISPN